MIAVVAVGAASPLGEGEAAFASGEVGASARGCVARDPVLVAAGLVRPFVARAALAEGPPDRPRDRAVLLLERALDACARSLDAAIPSWRTLRVGLALGTSSGGMGAFEQAGTGPIPFAGTYLGPAVVARRPHDFEPFTLVLGACASSTIAIGIARAWLVAGACDIALAGGYDAVSTFVASGFEALRATSATAGPRPFRRDRDGLALGEGAALLALAPTSIAGVTRAARAYVSGFGCASDAVHLTAPDREGRGLRRAVDEALAAAALGADAIDLVSAHGTATPFNDAAESLVIAERFGTSVPVHAFKGSIGHTLGAAGALESLAAIAAIERGIAPASYGTGPIERDLRVLEANVAAPIARTIKLGAAFGGVNAALIFEAPGERDAAARGHAAGREQAPMIAMSEAVALVDAFADDVAPARLASRTGYSEDKIARADLLVRLTLAAVAALEDRLGGKGALAGAGIVTGLGLATIETNALFLARIVEAGAARGEPRRFPFTTPNAAAGEASVAFGLTGPSFAVGGGAHGGIEALSAAMTLLARGAGGEASVDRVVVVAVDDAGPATARCAPETTSGAVAVLLARVDRTAEAPPLARQIVEARVRLPAASEPVGAGDGRSASLLDSPENLVRIAGALPPMAAHRALLPLVGGRPGRVEVTLPWGGTAFATFRYADERA